MKKKKGAARSSSTRRHRISLCIEELEFIRDLFGVITAGSAQTLSEQLAQVTDRTYVEAKLWKKLVSACEKLGVPTGEKAPDFVVAVAAQPTLGIFPAQREDDASAENMIEHVFAEK